MREMYDRVAQALGLRPQQHRAPRWSWPGVPDPFASECEARRFEHKDLEKLSGAQLARERTIARVAWAGAGENWWWERCEAVEAEIHRRRALA